MVAATKGNYSNSAFILINTALQTLQKIDPEIAKIEIGKKQRVKTLAGAVFMGTCKTSKKKLFGTFFAVNRLILERVYKNGDEGSKLWMSPRLKVS